jgi:hypothetical protein
MIRLHYFSRALMMSLTISYRLFIVPVTLVIFSSAFRFLDVLVKVSIIGLTSAALVWQMARLRLCFAWKIGLANRLNMAYLPFST